MDMEKGSYDEKEYTKNYDMTTTKKLHMWLTIIIMKEICDER